MSFSLTSREIDDVTILELKGRMSFPDPNLEGTLKDLLRSGRRRFVLDMNGVTYMDSYGIGDIVQAHNLVKNAGGKITMLRPVPNVKAALDITLKGFFEIFDDESAAVLATRS